MSETRQGTAFVGRPREVPPHPSCCLASARDRYSAEATADTDECGRRKEMIGGDHLHSPVPSITCLGSPQTAAADLMEEA